MPIDTPVDLGELNVELLAIQTRLHAVKNKLYGRQVYSASISCDSALTSIGTARLEVLEAQRAEESSRSPAAAPIPARESRA